MIGKSAIDTKSIPDSKRGAYGRVVKELKEVNATPDEVRRRAGNYVRRWGAEKLTPTALLSHWAEMDREPRNGVAKNADDVKAWLENVQARRTGAAAP